LPSWLAGTRVSTGAYSGKTKGADVGKEAKRGKALREGRALTDFKQQEAYTEATRIVAEGLEQSDPKAQANAVKALIAGGYPPKQAVAILIGIRIKIQAGEVPAFLSKRRGLQSLQTMPQERRREVMGAAE